ncbi:cytochrome c-type biogenesis CcmF C-terminal domain-containing protein [Sphingomonas sp. MMS24-JH45]
MLPDGGETSCCARRCAISQPRDLDQRKRDRDAASGQLYTVLGALGEDGRWQLRLWWKPFVTMIWASGALVALGGFLSLLGHRSRDRRQRVRREEAHA